MNLTLKITESVSKITVYILASLLLLHLCATATAKEQIDFTGFWKTDCDDAYGIQIRPFGEGLYTTHFCGPGGGCNRPQEAILATPILGDPDYEVISDVEIKDITGTLYKCTADTHPELSSPDLDNREDILRLLFIYALYLFFAFLLSHFFWQKVKRYDGNKRLFLHCAIIAIFFAPGILYSPFVIAPSFALFSVLINFFKTLFYGFLVLPFYFSVALLYQTIGILLVQIALSFLCMFIVWLLLLGFIMSIKRIGGQ